jgi:hypothetical protein
VLGGAITTALNGGNRRQIGAALTAGVVGEVLGSSNLPSFAATAASGCIGALVGGGNCGRGAGDALISMGINMAARVAVNYVLNSSNSGQGVGTNSAQGDSGADRADPPSDVGKPDILNRVIAGRYVKVTETEDFIHISIRGTVDYDRGTGKDNANLALTTINSAFTGASDGTGKTIIMTVDLRSGNEVEVANPGRLFLGLCTTDCTANRFAGLVYGVGTPRFYIANGFFTGSTPSHEFAHVLGLNHSAYHTQSIVSYDHTLGYSVYVTASDRFRIWQLYK